MNEFSVKTKICFGDALPELAKRMHRVFVVTDRFMDESGKIAYVTDRLTAAGAEYTVFSDIDGEPDISVVSAGVESLDRFARGSDSGCDAVVTLGGGAVRPHFKTPSSGRKQHPPERPDADPGHPRIHRDPENAGYHKGSGRQRGTVLRGT